MGVTSIEWADYTFNPWIGCEKVSAGCKNCYASVDTYARVSASRGLPLWGPGSTRHRTSEANWRKPLTWNRKARAAREIAENQEGIREHAVQPYRRPRVFCASLSDVFEGRADLDPWRADLWRLIEECTDLDWLLLTKRPENVLRMVPDHWIDKPCGPTGLQAVAYCPMPVGHGGACTPKPHGGYLPAGWPSHVWLGTSVENQGQADARIPHLLQVPAPVRFLSLEPLLGPVDLRKLQLPLSGWFCDPLCVDDDGIDVGRLRHVDWLIIGLESGPRARPGDVSWIRDLVRQGREAGVATFVKQLGARPTDQPELWQTWRRLGASLVDAGPDGYRVILNDAKGGDMTEWPADLRVREVPCARV